MQKIPANYADLHIISNLLNNSWLSAEMNYRAF